MRLSHPGGRRDTPAVPAGARGPRLSDRICASSPGRCASTTALCRGPGGRACDSVVFDLMQPLRPLWRLVDQFAKLWLDPSWQTASAHVIAPRAASALTVIGKARLRIRIDLATRLVFVVDMPRASWRGFLRLSLVSCPIHLSPATTRMESVRLHQVWQATPADEADEVPDRDRAQDGPKSAPGSPSMTPTISLAARSLHVVR
jgi:hypothetical protein